MKITFDVKNQILSRTDRQNVIANSTDYLESEVTFSEDWNDLEKTMQFVNGDNIVNIALENDKILPNKHLNLGLGTWKVSIIGISGDKKIVTNAANLSIRASGWIGAVGPLPSIYEQLLVIIQSLHTEAASSAVIRSAVQQYIIDNYDALVKEVVLIDDVRAALDDMVDDGTLSDVLDPLVAAGLPNEVEEQLPDVVASQIDEVVGDQIDASVASQIATPTATAAASWLSTHIDPSTGYVIDDSLTVQNAAADAKATGDAVSDLNSALNGNNVSCQCYNNAATLTGSIGANIYKCSEKPIKAETIIESIDIIASEDSSGKIFIVDSNDKIIDKIEVDTISAGNNNILIGKRYNTDVYVAVQNMRVVNVYSLSTSENLYSIGLYEAQSTDMYKTIGETITFVHNVPERYYEFGVKINTKFIGIPNIIDDLLGVSKPSDFIRPQMERLDEEGYSLFGHWHKMTNELSECANCGGASIAFKVKGSTQVLVDIEQLVYNNDPSYMMAEEPFIAYCVDNGDFTRVQIATDSELSVKSISIPDTSEHFVWIVIDGMCQSSGGANRSTGWSGIYIKSLTTDGTMYKVKPKGKKILYVGDSMVEGIDTIGTTSLSSSNSNIAEWSFKSAIKLHAFPLMQGYGGTTTWEGEEFELYSRPDYNADTYIVNNHPDIIVCEYGHNDFTLVNGGQKTDAEFVAQYRKLIAILENHYTGLPIVIITPFAQKLVADIVIVANTKNNYYLIDTSGYDYQTTDGTHPSAISATAIANSFSDDMIRIFGKAYFMS